jgi:hypothetical protein
MSKQMWLIAGVLAAIAVVTAYLVKSKSDQASSDSNSQLPAEEEAANYGTPPDIGASVNSGGGIQLSGNTTYTVSQGNSLPITPYS